MSIQNLNTTLIPPRSLTSYAQEQKHLRQLRNAVLNELLGLPESEFLSNIKGVVALADISGMLREAFPRLRYFSYSVEVPVEGVQILLPGKILDSEFEVLSEADTEYVATLLCEITDDDDTLSIIAPFAGMIDALEMSHWEPTDGVERALEILNRTGV